MTALQPSQGQFEFGQADAIVDWARSRGKQIHGHVLVWCADEWNPSWVTGRSWTREELLAVMEEHIRTVVDHFEGRVATWDVVNEALDDAGARKDCVWQRAIGDDWVEQAFRFARAADPSVRLFYNEYAADFPNAKFEGLVGLVKTLPRRPLRPSAAHLRLRAVPVRRRGRDRPARSARARRPSLRAHRHDLADRRRPGPAGAGVPDDRGGLPGAARVLPRDDVGFTDAYG